MSDKLKAINVAEQMALLRNGYLSRLPAELSALEKLAVDLSGGEGDRANLDELYHRLHKLAGSGGTFGLDSLSTAAQSLEQRIKALLEGSLEIVDAQTRASIVESVVGLSQTVCQDEAPRNIPPQAGWSQELGSTVVIWLVEDDVQLAQELVRQLESFNYSVRHFSKIDDAERAAKNERADMLIMDVMFEAEGENSTQALAVRPNLRKLDCPLMFISSMDDFQSRVRASRLGAQGYILKPLDVPRMVSRMVQVFEQRRALPQRVLIVDDDVQLAAHYRLVLLSAGLEVEVLNRPEMIIEKISAFRPELVLMDMHMPVFSGSDLAGVIRQYEKWASLPIIYLSTETDLDKQIEAMNCGADDFLTKPISNAQLIAAVRVRIERSRHLEGQINKDSLTGLLKHASIKEAVDLEMIRGKRNGKPVCVAMLDIDHFKLVNDTYGHAMGDVVISSVAMLLRQRLRQSDIIGRYGGEEFAVVLPECDSKTAYQLLDDLRKRFSSVRFSHECKDFNCAISVGLACSTDYPDSNGAQLLVAADAALYAAKRGGRNQVRLAPVDHAQEIKSS